MNKFQERFPQYRRDLELQTWIQEKLDQCEVSKCLWCRLKEKLNKLFITQTND